MLALAKNSRSHLEPRRFPWSPPNPRRLSSHSKKATAIYAEKKYLDASISQNSIYPFSQFVLTPVGLHRKTHFTVNHISSAIIDQPVEL